MLLPIGKCFSLFFVDLVLSPCSSLQKWLSKLSTNNQHIRHLDGDGGKLFELEDSRPISNHPALLDTQSYLPLCCKKLIEPLTCELKLSSSTSMGVSWPSSCLPTADSPRSMSCIVPFFRGNFISSICVKKTVALVWDLPSTAQNAEHGYSVASHRHARRTEAIRQI